jgi:hypothetical protein
MKTEKRTGTEQPQPFTPGLSRAQVRQHAFMIYRDRLMDNQSLTLQDWVLAEKDLVRGLDSGEIMPSQMEGR